MKNISKYIIITLLAILACIGLFVFANFTKVYVTYLLKPRTTYQKYNWKAEKYFSDPMVINLCHAIENNDLSEMEKLIKAGANVNAHGKDNMTPLMWAFPDIKIDRFKLLLDYGADPTVEITSDLGVPRIFEPGQSIVCMICKSSNEDYFKLIIDHGIDPNLKCNKYSHLIKVVLSGGSNHKIDRLKNLISKGANINYTNDAGTGTLLTHAFVSLLFDETLFLLENGADYRRYQPGYGKRPVNRIRLIHHVILMENEMNRSGGDLKLKYDKVVQWLKDHGEDFEEANEDIRRWRQLNYSEETEMNLVLQRIKERGLNNTVTEKLSKQ